ncbi:MAG TPA: trypsin-like peptidase domain-containing protein [Pontiella sp.]
MQRKRWMLIGFCGLMVLSALLSSVRRYQAEGRSPQGHHPPKSYFSPRQLPIQGSNPARQFSNAIADAVEKVMCSVVVVRTEKIQYRKVPVDPFGFLYDIVPEQLAGEGSGVIIDERGYVITSWHVLERADPRLIEIVMNDGTKLPASLVGFDKSTDLAVLKIESETFGCPVAEFGDSDALRVGEVVIAIGSPFSLQSSVTVGHVSQKGRRMQILPYEDFIQTDAAINQGNSGGPLIDVDGRLIGINAAIKTDAQKKGVGIAFAIPSNLAMVVAKSLIDNGVHEWPWVGAAFGKADSGMTDLQVTQVWRDTPAARSGVLPGDIVLAVNDKPVSDQYDIYRVIFSHAVGESVRFRIRRDGSTFEVRLVLEEFPGLPY